MGRRHIIQKAKRVRKNLSNSNTDIILRDPNKIVIGVKKKSK